MRGGRFFLVLVAVVALSVQCSVSANRVLLRSLSADASNTLQPDDVVRFVEVRQTNSSSNATTNSSSNSNSTNTTAPANASTQTNATNTSTQTNTTTQNTSKVVPDPQFYTTKIHIGCGRVMSKCQYKTDDTTNFKSVANVSSHHSCCDQGSSDRKWEKFSWNTETKECQLFSQRRSSLQCSSDAELQGTNATLEAKRKEIDKFVSGKPDAACRVQFQAEWKFNTGGSGPAYKVIATFGDTNEERECCARCVYDERCDFFNLFQQSSRCVLWTRSPRKSSVLDSEKEKIQPAKGVIAGQFSWA
jgi:hypothetical protein